MATRRRIQHSRSQHTRKKPKQHDYRDTLKVLDDCDRLFRSLKEPDRQDKRAEANMRKLDKWSAMQRTHPPGSFWHRWATFRIESLCRSDPHARTVRDALDDASFEMWLELRAVLWGLGYTIALIVAYILWFGFLIFVALPILWDWFWQLPPGLK